MPANRFSKFPDLPAELRRMIWSFCIPGRRVCEMHTAVTDHHDHVLGPADALQSDSCVLWSSRSLEFPVVSHVCREAREVVLESYVYITAEEGQLDDDGAPRPEWDAWNELPIRLRRHFDVVHVHWNPSYDNPVYLPAPSNPLPYFHWLAKQAAAASFNAELLLAFDLDLWSTSSLMKCEDAKYFIPRKLYYGVLNIVEIHMTYYEAAQAGVFGRLGEEPIQLVDPRDTAAVAAFRDVWMRHRLPSEGEDVADFFSHAVDSAEAYHARVEQWLQELETVWIWYKCKELRVPDATLERIWPDPTRPTGQAIRVPYPYIYEPPQFEQHPPPVLNKEHPWVREQLVQMPRFEPALMFRLCIWRCGMTRKSSRARMVVRGGRAHRGGRADR